LTKKKGLLLLDVDGPLNPYSGTNKPREQAGYRKYKILPPGWDQYLNAWLNFGHGAKLLALAEAADLELVWATTWEHAANDFIRGKVGLPILPVIEFKGSLEWKFPAVLDYAGDQPLAWFDDDFYLFPEPMAKFVGARGETPTLLHTVSPRTGLVDDDFDAVRTWAASL
jgi:hypothetical protein